MRIAYVCADRGISLSGDKGASIHAREIIRGFLKKGNKVEVFCARADGDVPDELKETPIFALASSLKGSHSSLDEDINALNLDLSGALAGHGKFDLVYERYSLWSFAALEYAWARGIPGLLEVNAPLIEEQARYRVLPDRGRAEQISGRAFSAASAIIAVSDEVAGYVKNFLDSSGANKVYVLSNGVDPQRFVGKKSGGYGSGRKEFTVGFVGSLKPWHGLMNLIEAFDEFHKAVPASRLLIVGDGPQGADLRQRVREAGLSDSVSFSGMVSYGRIPEYLASMDAAAAPYPDLEQFYFSPLKIFEYMAAGLPVVASAIGQIKSIIVNEENGLLVPAGDTRALSQALMRLYQDDKLCRRLGKSARQAVLERYTWDSVISRILEIAAVKKR